MASAVAANEVFGSVFYTFPPVIASAGVYSPVSLPIATSTLFLWRPIIEELTSAFSTSGANYTFLINSSTKSAALVGGALALLDYSTTSVVSAATASDDQPSRSHEKREDGIWDPHASYTPLFAALVAWFRHGNSIIHSNWVNGQPGSSSGIAHQIFNGVCLGMLGMTGFECSPDYVAVVRPGAFPKVLRNIHYPTVMLYALLMLVVLANIPLDVVENAPNVLSVLAERVGGRWMRIWVVVDASIVLSAGVLTGILSACALLEKLARDRVVPTKVLYQLPKTNAQAIAIASFTVLCGILYVSASANLTIISKMFAMTWLSVMTLFPISDLLLKFNRGRIPRSRRASLLVVFAALLVGITAFAGNIAIDPTTVGYFSAYAIAICSLFFITNNKARLVEWIYWIYDQSPIMHEWRWARRFSDGLVKILRRLRRRSICIFAKSDEIHHLFRMITYVSKNEETSCIKLVHFYQKVGEIPSEIEANAKLLDEAFPEITVDLIFVQAQFTPSSITALSHKLNIPRALMFMSCPGPEFKAGSAAELGTRIIAL
ncbi:hypothetical protein ACEPAI_2738 [Sanghuangporus weigelae]